MPLTFVSDRQKGLIPAVVEVFPTVRHRFCFRHMFENFRILFKGRHMKRLAWGASKAYRAIDHKRAMDQMAKDNKLAYLWLKDVPEHTWARSTFDLSSKCEHVTNNFSEAFNSWMLDVRCKPLHMLLEGYNLKMMGLHFERRIKASEWERDGKVLVPRAERILQNRMAKKNRYRLFGQTLYEWCVTSHSTGNRWDVSISQRSCSCCVWDITGIPCVHAVAVVMNLNGDLNSLVDEVHKVSTYKKAYASGVKACASKDNWLEEVHS
ncbi:hypothetical protein MKW94_022657 [Papaver nudicaule]|uniref:SWIM-type domain-containing protein n=1 Tax=Papaver nudicaule TaxID=74823 RepID=A0AA41VGS2_PAPNU|nr:hypothetical protein [Papaver nudicaule]